MKKIFKILSLVLAMCMLITCFAACDKKENEPTATEPTATEPAPPTFYETIQEISEIQQFDYSITVQLHQEQLATASDLEEQLPEKMSMYVKAHGTLKNTKEMTLNLEFKTEEDQDYIKLTDVYVNEEAIYVNVNQLFKVVDEQSGANGEIVSALNLQHDYYKLNMEDVLGEEFDDEVSQITNNHYDELVKDIAEIAKEFFQEAIKDVKPEVVNNDNGKFTFTFSNENAQQIIRNLGTILENNLAKKLDELIAVYEGKGEEYTEILDALNQLKENDMETINETIENMKNYEQEDVTFNVLASLELTGDEGSRKVVTTLSFDGEDEFEKIGCAINYEVNERAEVDNVSAPTNCLTEEEMELLNELFFGPQIIDPDVQLDY